MTQLTQEQDLNNNDDDESHCDNNIQSEDTSLNCHFHVVQIFTDNAGFVKPFKNRELVDSARGGLACKHVQLIHFCKNYEQRSKIVGLVLHHWKEVPQENEAADHFEKTHCLYPCWNWNCAATDEVGVCPTNCPNEALNKTMKDDATSIVALPRLLVETTPSSMEQDFLPRCSACTIDVPTDCTQLCVGLTGFLDESVDIVTLGEDEHGDFEGSVV